MGRATYGEDGCRGPGANTGDWAYRFLNGPLELSPGGGDLAFNLGKAMVTFEYLGVTPLGQIPLPRNDARCVAAHVGPFSCGQYRSVSGTGTLTFLTHHSYRLQFDHLNGELTSSLYGDCNSVSASLQPDGNTVYAIAGASSAMGCSHDREARDQAMGKFFSGTLKYRTNGTTLTFTTPTATAIFVRGY